ncbi:hypothetical protein K5D56_04450 [Pseudomonas cichorii]|nr:hypothetical protein [Pseudomonas cichorii]
MKKILFAGNDRQPCVAYYGIAIDNSSFIQHAHIVVVQTTKQPGMGTSLYNADTGRDSILNRILSHELSGVRVEFVTFNIILDMSTHLDGMRFPIRLDWDDFKAKGNPYGEKSLPPEDLKGMVRWLFGKSDKETTVYSYHVVGGCADFYTDLNDSGRRGLDKAEMDILLNDAEYPF